MNHIIKGYQSGMKVKQKEKGFLLISQLYFIILLAIIGSALLLLLVSVKRLQLNHYREQRAFYTAQSGTECHRYTQ